MNRFSIRDIENFTGIKAHTIRIWEQRYNILQPKRTTTNIRYYDAEDLKRALRVSLLNDYGYKISRIRQMTEAEMNALIGKINDKEFRIRMLVNELLEATLAMDVSRLEAMLDQYIHRNGIEQAVEQLIFYFLEKIGLMWLTDRLFPAQEHLVSNVISRKIAVAIERLPPLGASAGPGVLLFLPEGEIHELGLCYVHYLLRKYSKRPVYLGQNSPLREAASVYEIHRPEYLYVHLTAVAEEFDLGRYMGKLHKTFPNATVFVSGAVLQHRKVPVYPNVRCLHSLQEVHDVLIAL